VRRGPGRRVLLTSTAVRASFVILVFLFVLVPQLGDLTSPSPAAPPPRLTGDGVSPYINTTFPANAQFDLPVAVRIRVDFSEPMNTTSVNWTLTGWRNATGTWSDLNTTLELTATRPFRDCTGYRVNVTGRDADDNLTLVAGPVPNPWWFRTACINPFIVSTDPADRSIDAPLDGPINVTFSEPMNETGVEWEFAIGINLTAAWNRTREVLSLTPEVPLPPCRVLWFTIVSAIDDQRLPLVPGPVPTTWSWFSYCPNPFINVTKPPTAAHDVPMNATIVVAFSRPMGTATVNWSVQPAIDLTPDWSPGDTLLTLRHAANFSENTLYVLEITAGNDTGGLPLVPGPVPNPWDFVTLGINPFIVSTDPADGAVGVSQVSAITVTFSEPMNVGFIAWWITPSISFSSWPSGNATIITLTPTVPFRECTRYTVEILAGFDLQGLPLVPGPVPNPWSFLTYCPLGAPRGLTVTKLAPTSVLLSWQAVTGATGYKVYESQSRFAAWPAGWALLTPTPIAPTQYTHSGALVDPLTHYYIVRATDGVQDGPNSTMGVKTALTFGYAAANTNVAWFSLPFVSQYRRASDIANELGSTNIDVIGKWVPARQTSIVYYYARGGWRGTDFTIAAGDGLYLGVKRPFTWNVTGTDLNVTLSFARNPPPKANVNWISVPNTGVYFRASDISTALGSSRITEVGLWNAATQTVTRWYWSGTAWTGTDFMIAPGAGVYLIIASSFPWTPTLITPAVP